MLSKWELRYIWEQCFRAGQALNLQDLAREVDRLVEDYIEEKVEEEWEYFEDDWDEQAEIPAFLFAPDRREKALDEVVDRARFLEDLDGEYEEARWFAYKQAFHDEFDPLSGRGFYEEDDGEWIRVEPWEEPYLQAAKIMAGTVPFWSFSPN